MSQERPSIFYLDFLRCIAALAVIAIHVLGPFRELYSEIPDSEWLAAAGINSLTRWAVPVFMLISGALLLSSERAFNCEHYLTKRLSKVAVPFVGWTVIYAVIGGFTADGWSSMSTMQILNDSPNEPVWYHLWFFYDFIPLYFVIPFLIPVLKKASPELIKLAIMSWMVMFLMNWLKVESFLLENLILYSGYLVIGWYLFNRDNKKELKYWLFGGCSMLLFNFFGTWQMTVESGEYSSFFMGYKTLNTVIIGAMLFVTAQAYADIISGKLRALILVISKYSLGIYLLHPILLIPVRNLDNGVYSLFGSNWVAIPVITLLIMLISLLCTMLLVKIPLIKRLVP
ncbi:acyltransferase [Psychromonas ossibalaenae]|uniref:acyltransferase n=1 Tax=Psychromonas ossibalaenae TaxID=444922 RepID=UPI0003730513|nr:acyltransferase family protein [Psychromonas ossibalaenae]